MKKQRTLFILGIWTMALSFLGFPIFFKKLLFILTGLLISFIAYRWYEETKKSRESSAGTIENHWPKTISEPRPISEVKVVSEVRAPQARKNPIRRKVQDIGISHTPLEKTENSSEDTHTPLEN